MLKDIKMEGDCDIKGIKVWMYTDEICI